MKFVDVVLPFAGRAFYTYGVPEDMEIAPGQIVHVPFRRKEEIGLVVKQNKKLDCDIKKIKNIIAKTEYQFSQNFLEYLGRVSRFTMSDFGAVIRAALPPKEVLIAKTEKALYMPADFQGRLTPQRQKIQNAFLGKTESLTMAQILKRTGLSRAVIQSFIAAGGLDEVESIDGDLEEKPPFEFSDFAYLTDAQKTAAEIIKQNIQTKPVVLNGVTGSGKTEVYFKLAKEAIESGKQVLILLPEISLTVQFLNRFEMRFGRQPSIWHSHVTAATKRKIWKQIDSGQEQIVIGTRSALFLPFKNLGLVVVDEEHDGSYKQEDQFLYHARDMAVMRCAMENAGIILASATPSFETLANIEEDRYAEVRLTERVKKAVMPAIELVDLKENKPEKINDKKGWISPVLIDSLIQTFENKRQALLFLNRRGYAPLMICGRCGHRVKCPNCDVYMVYHQGQKEWLKCHHCDYQRTPPKKCEQCEDEDSFTLCGPGIERLAEEAMTRFPNQRVLVLSSENTQTSKQLEDALHKIENSEVDLIIGTQILAKGHHFPGLAVVGIVDADMSLMGADFRAGEKTLQLLEQTAGRAGRVGEKGTVFVQTHAPDHPVMQALQRGDKEGFVQQELSARK
ncbi:MAG: primosomal protein N', partial [Alphaproteobacteria bacterium]|nr:primosomal protein N' [Alphaproteobacteria bacterium]